MKLYIIRHGQTDWNIAKKIQGRQDIPLNERGHFQAQCLGKAMENRPITAVFSSPQIRAMETAIAVASPAGVPVIPVRDLMEINYGVWEGKTEEELLPVLKSTKAVSKEAYDQVIKTLNDAKAAVENSGTFSEIGKSGHAGASKGPDANSAEGKIDSIAKSYIEKNPTMSYVDALAKAWEDNPQLVLQYEEEAGI